MCASAHQHCTRCCNNNTGYHPGHINTIHSLPSTEHTPTWEPRKSPVARHIEPGSCPGACNHAAAPHTQDDGLAVAPCEHAWPAGRRLCHTTMGCRAVVTQV
jgi:hypothetical protein